MFDKNHPDWEKYQQLSKRLIEINRSNDFAPSEQRSKEDNEEFESISKKMDDIRKEYDKEFPRTPCPECGCKRTSFSEYLAKLQCYDIGRCRLAPRVAGG
jgi:ribosomal protein S27E